MNRMNEAEFNLEIERQIDARGLDVVLNVIGDLCDDKAEHLAAAWQDEPLAEAWSKAAQEILEAAQSTAVQKVS